MKVSNLLCASILFLSTTTLFAQETKKDEKKIQEVVTMSADPLPVVANEDGSVPVDTGAPKPMAQTEILKRAVNWVKLENKKYIKATGVTSGSKAECVATFNYKPKELNPQADVQGTFSMHVSIEAKEGKYRYTISKIMHNAKNAEYTGGDVNNEVPKCGSMVLPPDLWKRLRSEALKNVAVVVEDLKEGMKHPSTEVVNADEW
jgi:hypothetical protein